MIPTVPFSDPLKHVLVLQITHFSEVATFVGRRLLGVILFGCNRHISRFRLFHILLKRFFNFLLKSSLFSIIHFLLIVFSKSDPIIIFVSSAHNDQFLIIILHDFKQIILQPTTSNIGHHVLGKSREQIFKLDCSHCGLILLFDRHVSPGF